VEREEYPLDALPRTLLAAVKEVNAFVQAPMAMAVCSALAALSLAIQAHYDVERAVNLRGPVGLALMAIGDSGERKTTLDGFFTKAIRDYENAQAEIAKPLLKNFRAATAAWEAKHSGIKDKIRQFAKESKQTLNLERDLRALEDEEPEAIKIPSLLHGDVTPEELARCMAKDWPSGGIISSEAGVVLGSHGMGKESAMRNFSLLNQLWDGGEVKIGRKTSESFTVRGARLTIALQVQEATLREFLRESGALARGTGFLARFLIAWPETTQGHRPFTEAPSSWPHLAAFNQRIAAILSQPAPLDENGGLVPVLLTLTTEAKAAWVVFHDAVESKVLSKNNLNNL
jgi:putative DNA primase/helicase